MLTPSILLLILAIVGLLIGPLLGGVIGQDSAWRSGLDGMSMSLVGGFCLIFVLPHAYEHTGWAAILAAALGLATPLLIAKVMGEHGRLAMAASLLFLALHAALDGAALAIAIDSVAWSMGLAVVSHRLPVGLAVYAGVLRRSFRRPVLLAWGIIAVLILATLVGFAFGRTAASMLPEPVHGVLEGLVAGLLLHLVFEPRHATGTRRWRLVGAAIGLLVVTAFGLTGAV